ncbi:MAG: M28 family peptidase [Muribaculaceae bacterium]|nr:M28 family peptidase [Muribaculaceae bacterium]
MRLKFFLYFTAIIALVGCKAQKQASDSNSASDSATATAVVDFNGNNAYNLVKAQCDFGPRVPGTTAHSKCAEWLEQQLRDYCDSTIVQEAQVTTFDGTTLNIKNLIGSINPDADNRILLLAHWDCRPWADNDPDPAKHKEPVMGANDAASGVAVLLELARVMNNKKPTVGVDILLTDAEDWGTNNVEESWALGTQYWAKHPHVEGYSPRFGILLDMVGAKGAKFSKEIQSMQYAPSVVNEVWDMAQQSGYGSYFDNNAGGAITDDHIVVNQMGIKCIDIIDMRQGGDTGFFDGWHTTGDTLDKIDPTVLKVVGQTVANVIYSY